MDHRSSLTDGVIFIVVGTFLMSYVAVAMSRRHPDVLMKRSELRGDGAAGTSVLRPVSLAGFFCCVWGGTGLQHYISVVLAVVAALTPAALICGCVGVLHNRRVKAREGLTPEP